MKLLSVALSSVVLLSLSAPASAKILGAKHCHNGICHRILTLEETQAVVGKAERVLASYYDHHSVDRFTPGTVTSSGAVYEAGSAATVASPILPDGTVVLIRYPANGRTAVARVTDGGPYFGKRTLDLSRGLAEDIGLKSVGVAELELVVLRAPTLEEATFKKARTYAAVAGPVGTFGSLDEAMAAAASGVPQPLPNMLATAPPPAPSRLALQAASQAPRPAKQIQKGASRSAEARTPSRAMRGTPTRGPAEAESFVIASLRSVSEGR